MGENETKELRDFIHNLRDRVKFCALNGLLDNAALSILNSLDEAETYLQRQPPSIEDAKKKVNEAYCSFTQGINSAGLQKRLLYLYALHVWLYLIGLTFLFAALLYFRILSGINVGSSNVTMETLVWGGFGGVSYSIFYLRKNIYTLQFSKFYATYYFVYPIAGMLFGTALVMVVEAGLLIVQAKSSYVVHAAIGFLAGLLQSWALNTLKRMSEAIQRESS